MTRTTTQNESMTRELRHQFLAAAILVRGLGFLDFSKTSKNVKIDQNN